MSRNNQTLIKGVVSNCYFCSMELHSVSGYLKRLNSVSCMALEIRRNIFHMLSSFCAEMCVVELSISQWKNMIAIF
jgi:hypothetical protein